MTSKIFELLAQETKEYQQTLLHYLTQPCQALAIQNPVIKDASLILSHHASKRCKKDSCLYFHSYEEARRPIAIGDTQLLAYLAIPCPAFLESFRCDDVDNCCFSHSQNEILYHPTRYKTQVCTQTPCSFERESVFCPNIHTGEPSRLHLAKSYERLTANSKSKQPLQKPRAIMHLEGFKTTLCLKKGHHDKKTCPYYHNEIDRRRPITQRCDYCPELCAHIQRNYCSCDQNCAFSKNKVEQLYHPDRYKKKFCENFPYKIQRCEYGDLCSFAHKRE